MRVIVSLLLVLAAQHLGLCIVLSARNDHMSF